LELGKVTLGATVFNLKTYKGESKTNFTRFSSRLQKKSKRKKQLFELRTSQIAARGIDFTIVNENKQQDTLVAFYKSIKGDLFDFELEGTNVSAKLRDFSFEEKHGVAVVSFRTDFSYTPSQMKFSNTVLNTENTSLKAAIVFDYSRKGLRKFNDSVFIKAKFKDTYVHAQDLKK
jgi:hypothetical protein